jgi:hypothetical protein
MRSPRALLHAMRTWRTPRIDLDEADRLAAGDPPGPDQAGLGTLLDALRAPATAGELSAEKAAVAAYRTHRRRAARAARRTRSVLAPALTALALLLSGGTALAARTGNLPDGAQQHAHHLFSALGVPAPRTGPHRPTPSATTAPSPSHPAGPPVVQLGWCADWQPGGPVLSSENHRRLRAAAGSEERNPGYCDKLRRSAAGAGHGSAPPGRGAPASGRTPAPPPPSTPRTTGPPRATPSHPAPRSPAARPAPSHPHPAPGGGRGHDARPNVTPT